MSGFVLHLLRHGSPVRTGLLLGQMDEPALDPASTKLLERVRRLTISGIQASDLLRARATAEYLASERNLTLTLDRRWRELDFGQWDGSAVAALPRNALARFWNDPDINPPPEGERWSALRERVGSAIGNLSAPTLVVTHAGAMRAAISVLTGLDHRGVWALDLPYGALLSLRVWPGKRLSGHVVGLETGDAG